ncbi:hypothetical protein Aph02nite_82200 [Actinoplanes philippinensis]|uniref:Uncharacterized protein n=1 Tax=Actinoplanes philippinensis TaxID=35752 RepID=A0A1I2LTC5_9ACTN|nr:hypothetical protein [Actinoplanes philippinensis]GIE82270.1 hypothetical protein Aph02nite_82200 [Actinoplanes philippinensis]SFF82475.1 hypothetical protein SAMN05421541_12423 [Actinoplanes philippinensis]
MNAGRIFEAVYVALLTNLLLALACAPLVLVVLTTDPGRTWPLLVLFAPLGGPALVAVFAVLRSYDDGVLKVFWNAWRVSARRALTTGTLATVALLVLGVDAVWLAGRTAGAVLLPVIAVVMTLIVITTVLTLAALAERPDARLRDLARAGAYLGLRRWYLSLFSLVVLVLFEVLLAARPAIAIGVAASPLLHIVWANSRFTLTTTGRTT